MAATIILINGWIVQISWKKIWSILKKQEYITVDKLGAITLTDKGRERAQYIFERHKCLTKIFTLLGVNAETAAEDACKAEHILSEETLAKIREQALLHDAEESAKNG